MPGIKKQDVHVSFQRTRLVITWQSVTITDREEEGRIVRDRQEKTYSQNIPLPEGTRVNDQFKHTSFDLFIHTIQQFEQVRAAMDGKHLILRYPNMRSARAESHPRGDYFRA